VHTSLAAPKNVTRADRALVERLRALDQNTLKGSTGKYLSTFQIDAVLKRRDAILERLDMLGPAALFDRVAWAVAPPS
jgi:hypothetical protein